MKETRVEKGLSTQQSFFYPLMIPNDSSWRGGGNLKKDVMY